MNAQAQSIPPNSVDSAVSFCEKLAFKTDECMEIVNRADYFQKSLVQLCGHLASVENDKVNCIDAVSNKFVLVERMVSNCDKGGFWDSERKCISPLLKTYQPAPAATPTPTDTPSPTPGACNKDKVKSKLDAAMDQLKKFKYLDVYESLVDLKYSLRDCGF